MADRSGQRAIIARAAGSVPQQSQITQGCRSLVGAIPESFYQPYFELADKKCIDNPELFNEKKEMFGYERVVEVFNANANEKAEIIIEKLNDAGADWVSDSPPDDDVTFVVIKARG